MQEVSEAYDKGFAVFIAYDIVRDELYYRFRDERFVLPAIYHVPTHRMGKHDVVELEALKLAVSGLTQTRH